MSTSCPKVKDFTYAQSIDSARSSSFDKRKPVELTPQSGHIRPLSVNLFIDGFRISISPRFTPSISSLDRSITLIPR